MPKLLGDLRGSVSLSHPIRSLDRSSVRGRVQRGPPTPTGTEDEETQRGAKAEVRAEKQKSGHWCADSARRSSPAVAPSAPPLPRRGLPSGCGHRGAPRAAQGLQLGPCRELPPPSSGPLVEEMVGGGRGQ